MKRDHMMGYAPAAGEWFGSHPWFDHMSWALGMPKRVREAMDAGDKAWREEQSRPLLKIDHRQLTATDVRGVEVTKKRVLAQMQAMAAERGLTVQCRETWRAPDGVPVVMTRTIDAPASAVR